MNFRPQQNRSCNQRSLFINVLYAVLAIRIRSYEAKRPRKYGSEETQNYRVCTCFLCEEHNAKPAYTHMRVYVTEIVIRDNGYKLFSIPGDRNQPLIVDRTSIYYQYRKIVRKNSKRTDKIFNFHDDRRDCSFIILEM